MDIEIKLLDSTAEIPQRQLKESAGYDLYACTSSKEILIEPGKRQIISTQIAISIPPGYYGRIAPRSGLAVKHGIDIGAGVIDSHYLGEIKVLLFNFGTENYVVNDGDRIAQLIIMKYEEIDFIPVIDFSITSERGENGFGSTGK